jgi:hypothetical protein
MLINKELFSMGKISFWNFNIDEGIPFERQVFELSEDLIQIEFLKKKKILDIGWYPEFDKDGRFITTLIYGQNWDSPIWKETAKNLPDLYNVICKVLSLVND